MSTSARSKDRNEDSTKGSTPARSISSYASVQVGYMLAVLLIDRARWKGEKATPGRADINST